MARSRSVSMFFQILVCGVLLTQASQAFGRCHLPIERGAKSVKTVSSSNRMPYEGTSGESGSSTQYELTSYRNFKPEVALAQVVSEYRSFARWNKAEFEGKKGSFSMGAVYETNAEHGVSMGDNLALGAAVLFGGPYAGLAAFVQDRRGYPVYQADVLFHEDMSAEEVKATKCLEQTVCVATERGKLEATSLAPERINEILADDIARQTELCK